jgi:hypothetical protein
MGEISVRAGGAAGDGIASVGETLSHSLSRMGLNVFGHNAYQSVIRGGHVWFQARASTNPAHSQGDSCDVLYALNKETADVHLPSLSRGGTVVYDPEKFEIPASELPAGTKALPVKTLEIARKYTSNRSCRTPAGSGPPRSSPGSPSMSCRPPSPTRSGRRRATSSTGTSVPRPTATPTPRRTPPRTTTR